MDDFHYEGGGLRCEDVPLSEIAAGAGTPIGRICASAGLAAVAATAVNSSKELERRFIEPTNLFISKENPTSSPTNTSLVGGSPVALATQSPQFRTAGESQTNP